LADVVADDAADGIPDDKRVDGASNAEPYEGPDGFTAAYKRSNEAPDNGYAHARPHGGATNQKPDEHSLNGTYAVVA
jgi:hypothetical protein